MFMIFKMVKEWAKRLIG